MNILHVTPYYAPAYAFGGVPRAVEGMAVALARRGHEVTVLTTDALSQTERTTDTKTVRDGVRVVRAPNAFVWLRGRANLSTPVNMRAAGADLIQAANVIHCHEFRTVENWLITPLAAQHGKTLLLSSHGTLPHGTGRSALKTMWDRLISPPIARRFHAAIGLTDAECADVRALWRTFGADCPCYVVPNGVDMEAFASLPDAAAFRRQHHLGDAKVVLFMGRLHPRKGADVLARAVQQLNKDDGDDVRLLVAGPDEGLQPRLDAMAREDERIVLAGYLTGEARLAAFVAADAFALPAVGEGLPMSVLEAMAAGLPVVVSPGCNLPEVAQYGAGQEVPAEVGALAGALRAVLADDGTMAGAARRLVRARFTWAAVAAQLEQVYSETWILS